MKTSVMSAALLALVIGAGTATAGGVNVAVGDVNGDGLSAACETATPGKVMARPGKPGRNPALRRGCKAQPRRHCTNKPGYKATKGTRPAAARMVRADYCGNGVTHTQSDDHGTKR